MKLLIYRVFGKYKKRSVYVLIRFLFCSDNDITSRKSSIFAYCLLISRPIFRQSNISSNIIICRQINKSLCVLCFTRRPLVTTLIVILELRRYIHSDESDVNKMCSSAIVFFHLVPLFTSVHLYLYILSDLVFRIHRPDL